MGARVTLDALIPREDFEISAASTRQPGSRVTTLSIRDLQAGSFFFSSLRKPDFQRETSDWDPSAIAEFVRSFLEGDLIPAVILWQSSGTFVFVIDGAHRLSALISWVQDDYGDGPISRTFYADRISPGQRKHAERTRQVIKKTIGSYADLEASLKSPDKVAPALLQKAQRLGVLAVQVQWVEGDAAKAETSFFRINQKAEPINKVELRLLQSRRKANAIAARAIIRAGTGHKYWAKFDDVTQEKVESLAKEINDTLFLPELKSPIKTLDLPLAGRGYSSEALPLVFDYVNETANVRSEEKLPDDADGSATIECLSACLQVTRRIGGTHPSSLGLHPACFFYGANGRYQPTAFLAFARLIRSKTLDLKLFTKFRSRFEAYLVKYKTFVNQAVRKFGSGKKGAQKLADLFAKILELLPQYEVDSRLTTELIRKKEFSFLQPGEIEEQGEGATNFSEDVKSAAFLRDALKTSLKCSICNGYIHSEAMTFDHVQRKADGGTGSVENAKVAHPYCNTTYKN